MARSLKKNPIGLRISANSIGSSRSLDDNGNLLGTSRGSRIVSIKGYRERKMESFSPFQMNFQIEMI